MSWIALTPAHITSRIAAEELATIEAVGGGSGDRLSGILDQVTALVRAKVSACHRNTLGPAGTIPEECLWAAATIAKRSLRGTLPSTGDEDEKKIRDDEWREATRFLDSVASCDIGIADDGDDQAGGFASGCYGGETYQTF
ncbi:MAG: hypothetical protein ACQKBY_06050 [Verrucomicrobiales bacterium]